MKPKHFTIEWDGIRFSGTLTRSNENPALGEDASFAVNISLRESMRISMQHGKWFMPGAPQKFANALGLWIESHYD